MVYDPVYLIYHDETLEDEDQTLRKKETKVTYVNESVMTGGDHWGQDKRKYITCSVIRNSL